MSDPDTGTWTYVYDQANNLVRQSNGAGQWTGIDYDTLGRPTRRYKTDSNGTDNGALATFNYDPAGATGKVASSVAETDDGQVTVGYEYDNRDQLTRQTWTIPGLPAGSAYIGWTYDDGGLVDTIDYNGTETIDYTYDLAGRPITLVGGTETYVSAATYTASGQLTTLTSGAANDPNRLNRTWQYDPASLLV